MSITFEKVKWRNFLSTGDTFTEIVLNAESSTLFAGPNGAGKSTLLDALSFVLFGKPHRDIKKHQLVNSVNNRDCEVEIDFRVAQARFKIIRGIKPNKFEIWQNGTMINQESHSRDYQKFLEQSVLKLNHKSFHQIVVLGSSSFIPFMQLPTHHRREVIEDLLDINVFTKMNVILKERTAKLRDALGEANYHTELVTEKIKTQNILIANLKSLDAEHSNRNQEKIAALEVTIKEILDANTALSLKLPPSLADIENEMTAAQSLKQKLLTYQAQIENNVVAVTTETSFYVENHACPKCMQPISPELKETRTHECTSKLKDLVSGQQMLNTKLNEVGTKLVEAASKLAEFGKIQSEMLGNQITVVGLQKQITELLSDQNVAGSSDIVEAERILADHQDSMNKLGELKNSYYEQGSYNQAISEMLKDTGIKTKVIKQYLPVMNKLVNNYLQVLDFFVSFHLDENFEETIKSRHRDEFTYASFSEGEKQRIDLALLFTWRQIARMKNSVSTNLLVLDETFDSSMDGDGLESLLKILGTLEENTNVFIISHKTDALDGKFKARIDFAKEKNFSVATLRNS